MTTPLLRASLVALSVLAAGPVLAQATGEDNATTVVEGETTTTTVEGQATTAVVEGEAQAVETTAATEDDGLDLGWLGLLGLLGLAGLRGRRPETVATHPTVTTHSTAATHPTVAPDVAATTYPTTVTTPTTPPR